jgi:hypothetical protein
VVEHRRNSYPLSKDAPHHPERRALCASLTSQGEDKGAAMADRSPHTGSIRDPGVLIQIHIPRCAGTSVGNWLRAAAQQGLLSGFRAVYPDFVLEQEADFLAAGFADLRLTAATTHNILRFPTLICGRVAHYFTLLREPFAHVLSIARYMQEQRSTFMLPANLGNETQDILVWLLGRPLNAPFRENTQTNHLALATWCEATSGRCAANGYGTWSAADQRAYQSERLDVAKSVLRSFLCVGVVERLHDSLELLRQRSAAVGIDLLPAEGVGHVNTTLGTDNLAWTGPANEVGRRLHESIAVDIELYAFAREMLQTSTSAAAARDGIDPRRAQR